MSQTQQTVVPPQNLPVEEPSAEQVEPEVGSWSPYLDLMKNWQRADSICAKAVERAEFTRQEEEQRARNIFESEKTKLESARKERADAIENERKSERESADRLLTQAQATQTRVRRAMETIGLEPLMNAIDVPPSLEQGNAAPPLDSLRDTVANSITIEESLQDDLFDLRAARQRQSAQMWGVGIGLWIVAVLVFAPYSWISALLVAIAAFVIATPRKIDANEALRPSFSSHIGHCIALLFGKQQVMQHPFALVEKGRTTSGDAFGGAIATASIAWLLFFLIGSPVDYNPIELLKHLALVSVSSIIAGSVSFAVANHDLTFPEMIEGEKNRILK